MSKIKTKEEMDELAKDLTKDHLEYLFENWVKEQTKWDQLEANKNRHYMVKDVHHEILSVDSTNRLLKVLIHPTPEEDKIIIVRDLPPTYLIYRTKDIATRFNFQGNYSEYLPF
jgi:hypothetical protein